MKKILLSIIVIIATYNTIMGQTITTSPVIYAPDEEVTWYFDMSEQMQVEGEPFYIWAWAPSNPEDILGTVDPWDNPSDACTLKYVGNGIYKLTLVPTEFFGVSAEDLYANNDIFWLNIRNGAKEVVTGSLNVPHPFNSEFQNFIDSENDLSTYPAKFTYKDDISILVNLDRLNIEGQGVGALVGKDFGNLHIHSGLNEYADHIVEANMGVPELVEKTKFKKVNFPGGNIYKLDMKPQDYYNITDDEILSGYKMQNIMFSLPTTNWVYRGVTAIGSDFKLYAGDVEPDPDPVFSYFPQRLSKLDFLTLVRTYDDASGTLHYAITGGNTTLEGDFDGARARRTAIINLLDGLKNETDVTKLHIVLNRAGTTVDERDIPLVSVSEIEK